MVTITPQMRLRVAVLAFLAFTAFAAQANLPRSLSAAVREWRPKLPPQTFNDEHGSGKEPTRRIRFLTQDQAITLLRELPLHLREMAIFALATGLRAANVTRLTWEQVDLSRSLAWVHPDQAKARRAIAVPLNDMAATVLARQVGKHYTVRQPALPPPSAFPSPALTRTSFRPVGRALWRILKCYV